MIELLPTIRYLIVCEDVHTDPDNPRRISLVGLIGTLRSIEQPAYPLVYSELCVFIQLTECRGPGDGRIEIRHADTDLVAFRGQTRTLPLGNNPLEVFGVTFRIKNCIFQEAGLYWVQLWYNERTIAQQPLLLR